MKRISHYAQWVGIVVCLVFVISLCRSIYFLWQRTDIVHEREKALQKLQDVNTRLKEEVALVQTPEFIEKEARDKLGLSKPGEQVILFDSKPVQPEKEMQQDRVVEKPSFAVWWKVFF